MVPMQALAQMNSKKEFTESLGRLKSYLIVKSVPTDLRSRILEYYEYLFTSSAALDDNLGSACRSRGDLETR